MRHFFSDTPLVVGEAVLLSQEDSNHLLRVLRGRVGKELSLAYEGSLFTGILQGEEGGRARVLITEERSDHSHDRELILCQGVPKGKKLEDILQHGTEVGVDCFIPLQMDRSIGVLTEKFENKRTRYEKIIEEAAKQANCRDIPEIEPVTRLKDVLNGLTDTDGLIFCYEEATEGDITELDLSGYERIFYFIGPEGGFSPEEASLLRERGAHVVSLGENILRTETAALVAGFALKRILERN